MDSYSRERYEKALFSNAYELLRSSYEDKQLLQEKFEAEKRVMTNDFAKREKYLVDELATMQNDIKLLQQQAAMQRCVIRHASGKIQDTVDREKETLDKELDLMSKQMRNKRQMEQDQPKTVSFKRIKIKRTNDVGCQTDRLCFVTTTTNITTVTSSVITKFENEEKEIEEACLAGPCTPPGSPKPW
jgi:hypothetical protein